MKNTFEIGIVTGVHGVRGDLKIFPYTNDPANLSKQSSFILDGREFTVTGARVQGKFIVAHLQGIENRDDALALKNKVLTLERENASPLEEGHYYMEDIIGCEVYENDVLLGVVDDIMETGANDVYSVFNENNKEILIPAIRDVVKNIDIDAGRIEVILPEGLLDDEYI